MKLHRDLEQLNRYQQWKDKILRVKTLCLHEMGKSCITNVKRMKAFDKQKLLTMVTHKMETMSDDEIVDQFNALVCDELFDSSCDYTTYPVGQVSRELLVPEV